MLAERQIPAAIRVERREHIRALGEGFACQFLHQHADLLGSVIGVVQLCGDFHRLVAEHRHVQMDVASCLHLGAACP